LFKEKIKKIATLRVAIFFKCKYLKGAREYPRQILWGGMREKNARRKAEGAPYFKSKRFVSIPTLTLGKD
jgi:hypothetical protein